MVSRMYLMIALFMVIECVYGQFGNRANPYSATSTEQDTTYNESDTIINKAGILSIFKGEPGKAALYSLVIPGGGQVYNKKWWKVPLALGIDGGLIGLLIFNRQHYKSSQASYQKGLSEGAPNIARLKQIRDFYRKQSEYGWIWLLVGHITTVADAFVDRHLMTFDVSDDISFQNNLYLPMEVPTTSKVGFVISLNYLHKMQAPKIAFSIK